MSIGMVWGAVAGVVIGTGISMSIGLFYSAAMTMIGAVILVSALMGAVFGHVMSHLLAENESGFLVRAVVSENHQLTGDIVQTADLADHRKLKIELQARKRLNQ
jgi:hypothetical protein